MDQELSLTPTQALGVALSCAVPGMEMGDCQELAVGMIEHLKNMGFNIIKILSHSFIISEDSNAVK